MRFLIGLAISLAVAGTASTPNARTICSTAMYDRADTSLEKAADSWPELFQHYRAFRSCEDGALAEGYSEAVVKLFANAWAQFPKFVALAERDAAFRRWAIGHIDASTSSDDLKNVVRQAERCAGDFKTGDLCRRVKRAAMGALKDSTSIRK